ncbi:hypothetical protein R6Q57_002998 [Mikania cordata]
MEGGLSRGGSSRKKIRKPRPKNIQTAQMKPFNTPGYRPQMSSPNQPNFYYDPMNPAQYLQYSPDTQQQFNRWEQSYQQDQQNYRDHNQDDSDSSEHNKSVQVESEEEEEEPVRRTRKKAIGKKTPAKRWSDEEEVALARSWLTISENLDVGNAQKKDVFYRKGKRSAASFSSHEELIQQMAEFNSFNIEESQQRIRLQEEKLRVLKEEKDARI